MKTIKRRIILMKKLALLLALVLALGLIGCVHAEEAAPTLMA